jgi:hypothetical protein
VSHPIQVVNPLILRTRQCDSETFVKKVQERQERRRTVMRENGGAWTLRETPG